MRRRCIPWTLASFVLDSWAVGVTQIGSEVSTCSGRGHCHGLNLLQRNHAIGKISSLEQNLSYGVMTGYWRFEQASENPNASEQSSNWSCKVPDDSGMGNFMWVKRYNFRYPYAEVQNDVGLAGSGGLHLYNRSYAIVEMPMFRTLSVWFRRDVGCCVTISRWLRAKLDGNTYFKLSVEQEHLVAKVKGANINISFPKALEQTWDHIAIVVEASKVILYVNGHPSEVSQVAKLGTGNVELRVGAGSKNNPFLGIVDEIRAYSEPLPLEAILAIVESSLEEVKADDQDGTLRYPDEVDIEQDALTEISTRKTSNEIGIEVDVDGGHMHIAVDS